jgi:hypothetical protein
LLDGVLQCQPVMFSRDFARHILAPASVGQPAVLSQLLHLVGGWLSAHPSIANCGFALIQILLGLVLLSRRFIRVALAASVAWALSVWIVGEGLGGLAAGGTILTGAPGAALFYAVIALLAWPSRAGQSDEPPSRLALPAWCTIWLVGAGLQLMGGNNSSLSFPMTLRAAQLGAPGWLAFIDRHLAQLRFPVWTAAVVVALYVLVAIWALVPGRTRQLSAGIGVFISLTGWLLFQGLGDLTSGKATDPNSGPLMVLLALAVVGAYPHKPGQNSTEYAPSAPLVRGCLVDSTQ